MPSDDKEFDEIYRSITPGLVVAACSPKSMITLRSFCFALKGAAIRCGSDVMLHSGGDGAIDWNAVGAQITEHAARGVRVFAINRFHDLSPPAFLTPFNSPPPFHSSYCSISHTLP